MTHKLPGRLNLKKFGPGKLGVKRYLTDFLANKKKGWAQNIFINFLAELDNLKTIICFTPD